jgi:hypothetical protein
MDKKRKAIIALTITAVILVPSLLLMLDFDGDGLSNINEYGIGTDPDNPDTDGDGLSDYEEVKKGRDGYRTNPLNQDSDSDGLLDYAEVNGYGTNPNLMDTDGEGLNDSEEVQEGQDGYITDPLNRDSDSDMLTDYDEVNVFATNPVERDSDFDGLSDYDEVHDFKTNPNVSDTDGDRLSDYEEVNEGKDGHKTNPLKPDSDADGLSDYEEVYEYETNPNLSDSDQDGARDPIDLMPTGYPNINWLKEFDPGLIRLSLDVGVYSVRGRYAEKWEYQGFPFLGSCEFVADDTEGATKSSEVTPVSVVRSVNSVLEEGEQGAFEATDASYVKYEGTQYRYFPTGHCIPLSPKYEISYAIDEEIYRVSLINSLPTALSDSEGKPYWFTHERVPVEPNIDQTLSLQFHLTEASTSGDSEAPGFAYYLYKNEHFGQHEPISESVSPGIDLGDGIYQVDLPIDRQTANAGEVLIGEGRPAIVLVLIPVWIEAQEGRISRSLEPSSFNMVASNHRYTSQATLIIPRRTLNISEVEEAIPDDISNYAPGPYRFGSYEVCVIKSLGSSDCRNLESIDAVVIISESLTGLQQIKSELDWGEPGVWFEEQRDPCGNVIDTFSYFLEVLDIDRQLLGFGKDTTPAIPSSMAQSSQTSLTVVEVQSGSDGERRHNVHQGEIRKDTEWEKDIGSKKTSKRSIIRSIGVFRDLEKSPLYERLGDILAKTLKAAKIGTILVSNGREAWLAYMDGDNIQGSLYVAKGGVGTFSVLVEDRTLGSLGVGVKVLKKIPVAKLARIILGVFANGYAISKIAGASNEFERRVLIHQACTGTIDFVLTVVLGWGAFYLGWGIGVTISYAIIPNDMAAKIMSTPISFVAFIWTVHFTDLIPKEIAEDALNSATQTAVESAQYSNAAERPAIVVLP